MILAGIGIIDSTSAGGSTLLLDNYPGAKRAYSIRKLSSSYSGSCMRIRRSSDNSEQDIGFVNGELDTAAISTFISSSNAFVTIWYDQSGNGVNATQSTALSQPQIAANGVIWTINSKPTIYALNTRSLMTFTAFTTTEVAQLLVGKKKTANTDRMTGFSGPGGPGPLFAHWQDDNIYFQWKNYYSFPNSGISSTAYEVLFGTTITTSTSQIWRNGSSLALSNNALTIADSYSCIFAYNEDQAYYSEALEQELVIWDSGQSTNSSGIQSNVNTYYSIY
jgi:hypothetical protein